MKKATLLFFTVFAVMSGVADTTPQHDSMAFYNKLSSLDAHPSEEESLRFLSDAAHGEWGGFGGGTGPDDSDSRQMSVLKMFARHFLDEKGDHTGIIWQSENHDIQQWADRLFVSSSDTEGILKLLGDPSPPVRWLGLKKAGSIVKPPDSIIAKLEDMALTDDYVRMALVPRSHALDTPPPPGWEYSDFRALLRDFAADILQRHGRNNVKVDNDQVALLGLVMLNDLCETGRNIDNIFGDGLYALEPGSCGYTVWREARFNREKYPQLSTLFFEWDARVSNDSWMPSYILDDRDKIKIATREEGTSPQVVNSQTTNTFGTLATEPPRPPETKSAAPVSPPKRRTWLWFLALPVVAEAWLLLRAKRKKK